MPHVMIPSNPFRRASIPDPHPPQPPVPDPAPEPGPSPLPDPDPTPVGGTGERGVPLAVVAGGDPDDGGEDAPDEQSDPGGDSDPHPPLPEPGAAA
jgi:hypothetical protein